MVVRGIIGQNIAFYTIASILSDFCTDVAVIFLF